VKITPQKLDGCRIGLPYGDTDGRAIALA